MIQLPHVDLHSHLLKVFLETQQLSVLPTVVGKNWDPVEHLVEVTEGAVVDQDHFRKVSVYDSEVLSVYFVVQFDAMLSVESKREELVFGVDLIEDGIGVAALTGSESYDFKVLFAVFEETEGIGPDGDIGFLWAPFDGDVDLDILRIGAVFLAMEQGFIKI